jgi:hypothetical protein
MANTIFLPDLYGDDINSAWYCLSIIRVDYAQTKVYGDRQLLIESFPFG